MSVVTQGEVGAPGVVVGVSVDGSIVWCEGEFLLDSLYSPGHQYCCFLHFYVYNKVPGKQNSNTILSMSSVMAHIT